jgi:hypothetical protein
MPEIFQSLSNVSPILRIRQMALRLRRNHGLEHATLNILSKRFPNTPMGGHSSINGFWLLGEIPTEAVQKAVQEGLHRMKNGEHQLAVHANCGTNFAVSGTLAGVAGASAMLGVGKRLRDKLDRLALAASLATMALILSQPLGLLLQANVTTSGEPGDLEVVEIVQTHQGWITAHHVITQG